MCIIGDAHEKKRSRKSVKSKIFGKHGFFLFPKFKFKCSVDFSELDDTFFFNISTNIFFVVFVEKKRQNHSFQKKQIKINGFFKEKNQIKICAVEISQKSDPKKIENFQKKKSKSILSFDDKKNFKIFQTNLVKK